MGTEPTPMYRWPDGQVRQEPAYRCGAFDAASGDQCTLLSDHIGAHVLEGDSPPDAPSPVRGEPDDLPLIGIYGLIQTIGGGWLIVDESEEGAPVARFSSEADAKSFWHLVSSLLSDRERMTRELETVRFNAALLEKQVEVKAQQEAYYAGECARMTRRIAELEELRAVWESAEWVDRFLLAKYEEKLADALAPEFGRENLRSVADVMEAAFAVIARASLPSDPDHE